MGKGETAGRGQEDEGFGKRRAWPAAGEPGGEHRRGRAEDRGGERLPAAPADHLAPLSLPAPAPTKSMPVVLIGAYAETFFG